MVKSFPSIVKTFNISEVITACNKLISKIENDREKAAKEICEEFSKREFTVFGFVLWKSPEITIDNYESRLDTIESLRISSALFRYEHQYSRTKKLLNHAKKLQKQGIETIQLYDESAHDMLEFTDIEE